MSSSFALLSIIIATGVRHQIRVHLSSIGFPIAGDKLYRKAKTLTAGALKPPRHLLHAAGIKFIHPATGRHSKFSVPLPADFKDALANLKLR